MQFELLTYGRNYGEWWFDLCILKVGVWEPALLRLSRSAGKFSWDLLGWGELTYWWKTRRR